VFKALLVLAARKFLIDMIIDVLVVVLTDLSKKSTNSIDDIVTNKIQENSDDIKEAIKGSL